MGLLPIDYISLLLIINATDIPGQPLAGLVADNWLSPNIRLHHYDGSNQGHAVRVDSSDHTGKHVHLQCVVSSGRGRG